MPGPKNRLARLPDFGLGLRLRGWAKAGRQARHTTRSRMRNCAKGRLPGRRLFAKRINHLPTVRHRDPRRLAEGMQRRHMPAQSRLRKARSMRQIPRRRQTLAM